MPDITYRPARAEDLDAIAALMAVSIGRLLRPFLNDEQIEASRAVMGLDRQLVADGTYFAALAGDDLAGCGGWSRRATLYGGDAMAGRDAALLRPGLDAARVRAMYTHPDHVRRGIGRRILELCEDAARREGFTRVELVATMAGLPLYQAAGFKVVERLSDDRGGAAVPLARMTRDL
ncbi:MAG: GNAT family N-acetyltransferase [Paracoccaceae bacterium]